MTENKHWLDRWKENRIGFHEDTVNRYLQKYLPILSPAPGASVFLPLCGKALDIAWIVAQGYDVVGIELSEIAIESFFEENRLPYQRSETDRFEVYRSKRITLLRGDFFDLRGEDLGDCALVYDRAALIAMTREQRPRYYEHMLSIVPEAAEMLLITLDYDPAEMQGPPYNVPEAEVRRHYGGAYAIDLLESHEIVDQRPRWRKVGLTALREAVFRLSR